MTCGVHLGIFLIVLVQAEHVRCLWASQAAQSKNNNTYVGFRQNNREAGVNYLQNRLRQAQSRNLNIPSAVGSRFSWGPSTGGYTQTVSQPAKSGLAKVRLVQGSSVSKPNLNRVPKQRFHGLSSAIVGSDSLSKSSNKDTQKSSSLFGAGAPEPNQTPARTKTSSSVRAKLVSKTDKPSRPSAPKNPSQTEVVNPYKSKLFSGNAGNARGSYKATSMASSYGTSLESNVGNGPIFKPHSYSTSYDSKSSREGTSGKKLAPTKTHIIPEQFGGYAIRRLKAPGQEKVSVRKPQQAYQTPIKAYVAPQRQATNQAYNAPQQQTLNRVYETSNKAYETPNRVYNAPNRAHETPNRAHETPNRAHETPNRAHETPNRAYETPNRTPNRPYETPNRPYETPNRPYETPNRPYETPKKAYVAPQRQATNQAYKAPNRAYVAPQRQAEPQAYIFPQVAPLKSRVLT
ncbi:DNA-directed RNA polymerase II subunit RPB1-like isoform X1 [Gymnodraco acuticeps]|uniref:DNA-directed RNA polymerase II subunit RPB1-like isoform X1 n=1 Tax=Gymnodraco acuticeps TaxID=8218 RepID=A0A6P8V4M8_GYMAC|nr:DNA-directed RNA polymerase II subunit RPB1-like isoform X1 [Gymnodraco acuticeps]